MFVRPGPGGAPEAVGAGEVPLGAVRRNPGPNVEGSRVKEVGDLLILAEPGHEVPNRIETDDGGQNFPRVDVAIDVEGRFVLR